MEGLVAGALEDAPADIQAADSSLSVNGRAVKRHGQSWPPLSWVGGEPLARTAEFKFAGGVFVTCGHPGVYSEASQGFRRCVQGVGSVDRVTGLWGMPWGMHGMWKGCFAFEICVQVHVAVRSGAVGA